MSDFIVYGSPLSPFVRKVEAVLECAGQAFDFENINIMDMPDWFLEISPLRRIPVLRDKTNQIQKQYGKSMATMKVNVAGQDKVILWEEN